MKKLLGLLTITSAVVSATACNFGGAFDENDQNASGVKMAIYDMAFLDMIDNIGYDKFGIDMLSIPDYLAKDDLAKYIDVRTQNGAPDLGKHNANPSIEPLTLLDPDHIVMSSRFKTSIWEQVQTEFASKQLLDASFEYTQFLPGMKNNATTLAKWFPKLETEITTKMNQIESDVNSVKTLASQLDKKAVIITAAGSTLTYHTAGGRYDMITTDFGFKLDDSFNSCPSTSTHGCTFQMDEFFDVVNPDIVFMIDTQIVQTAATESVVVKQLEENAKFKATNAYQNGKYITLSPQAFYNNPGGFSSTQVMIDNLKGAL